MLAIRIIPTLLHRGDVLVKGKKFNAWRSVGHVQQAARIHASRGVDELVILDIGATPMHRGPDFALVEKLTDRNFTPIAVGGGIKAVADVERLLRSGADKVVLGNVFLEDPMQVEKISRKVGSQAVVIAIDTTQGKDGVYVGLRRGQVECTALNPVMWARQAEKFGAGEILLTSIDREGTMEGYDLETIRAVSEAVTIPVVAHGGCGSYEHMHEAILAGASAVAAGALFQFTDCTPKGAAEYLKTKGIEVRL